MKLTCSVKIKPMTYRTLNLNPIFRLIHSFKGNKNDSNKKRTSKNTSPSCVVAGTGFIASRCFAMDQRGEHYVTQVTVWVGNYF